MTASADRLNAKPLDNIEQLTSQLTTVASNPLAHCPQFPAIAKRFETWWKHERLDSPIFVGTANRNPNRPITRRLDLLPQADRWMTAKLEDLIQTHIVGDALPHIRVDFGAATLGGLIGAETEFGSDTTWTHALINEDWSNAPDFSLQEHGDWWNWLNERMHQVCCDAAGKYLVCLPDLGGSNDAITNMRGPSELCMDVIEQPQKITSAQDAIYPVWRRVIGDMYRIAGEHHAGLIHWLLLWSNSPYTVITCDFNALIGPAEFESYFVPDITRQAATMPRAVFHLDGPDAARHMDALLKIDELDAIQFTPGTGTPSVIPWLEMLKKVLDAGKSMVVFCPVEEVTTLHKTLGSTGVAMLTSGTVQEIDNVYADLCRKVNTNE